MPYLMVNTNSQYWTKFVNHMFCTYKGIYFQSLNIQGQQIDFSTNQFIYGFASNVLIVIIRQKSAWVTTNYMCS